MGDLPVVSIGEVAVPVQRAERPVPGKGYRQIGVRLWGEGAYEREPLDGAETKYANLFRVEQGDIVVNKIWARHGSVAVVDECQAGAFVSSEFPVFSPIPGRLYPRWFHWMTKTSAFWEKCDARARGTSGKNRIRPEQFQEVVIPLPLFEEQRRIVDRIEMVAAKIEEARSLRRGATAMTEEWLVQEELRIWPPQTSAWARPLADVTTYLARGRQSQQGESDHLLIKTQHVQMGKYVSSTMTLAPNAAVKVTRDGYMRDRDILIACSAAGCLGRVAMYCAPDTEVKVSTDTHVAIARADTTLVLPEYLYAYLKGPQGQFQLRSRERGDWKREKVGFRLTELNLADLRQVPVPVPSFDDQRRIVSYLESLESKASAVRQAQAETAAGLDALLPSVLDRAFNGEL